MRSFILAALLVATVSVLNACNNSATWGKLPSNCSGVPGDLADPGISDQTLAPTHGPGTQGLAMVVPAIAKPLSADAIPFLCVFDDQGNYALAQAHEDKLLNAPIFRELEDDAFWFEVADGAGYRIPWLDRCSIASMLSEPFPFKAPDRGLLFVQFVAPECARCTEVSGAIPSALDRNPNLPVAWVQVEVSRRIGRLQPDEP